MHRRIYPIVGLVLLVLLLLGLAVGCGETEEPTATSALEPQNAEAYFNRGLGHHDKGDLDQAIADYDQAIVLDPQYALAYYNRGNAYYLQRRPGPGHRRLRPGHRP